MSDHYGYLLDPEIAMVQLFRWRGVKDAPPFGRNFEQIVSDGESIKFLPRRTVTPTERRLLWEAGRPPLPFPQRDEVVRRHTEPCLYCGKAGVPIGLINSFSLPLYNPRGHTCQFCGRTVVLLD